MDAEALLRLVDETLKPVLNRGMGKKSLASALPDTLGLDEEMRDIAERLRRFLTMIDQSYWFAEELSAGRLDISMDRSNVLAMPLKALQANLRHLSWQAHQVAEGDLSQEVHFLGEFSVSFNRMIHALREKADLERRLQTITDVLGEGVFLADAAGNLLFMNPEAQRLLGYDCDELTGKPFLEIIYFQDCDGTNFASRQSPLSRAIREGREYVNDNDAFTCKSGLILPVSIVCRPVFSGETNTGAVVAFKDITEQKKYRESLELINTILEKQATTDPLTGIYNRMKFSKLLDGELKRSQRYNSPLSIILLDIDKFKDINDTYGHLDGDAVLKELAALLARNLRSTDCLARWGGEEFILMAPGSDLADAARMAEKLRARVAVHNFPVPRVITSSFGVAAYKSGDTELTLTNRADQALYVAKDMGRNRVEVSE